MPDLPADELDRLARKYRLQGHYLAAGCFLDEAQCLAGCGTLGGLPVTLIHGRDDTVVPIEQSRIMANALRDAGKPVELIELAGEDHWMSRAETRQRSFEPNDSSSVSAATGAPEGEVPPVCVPFKAATGTADAI